MSKYQPRIIINNPEKQVPDSVVQQFFMKIKNGDVDGIRDFAIQYKNKYNLIEKTIKGSSSDSRKTPAHIVLELDNKVADDRTKLRLLRFLDMMGAPMDLPDINQVWPIHLAASLQSPEIINFLIKKKVSLIPKDSSNNTPLHYAVMGHEITCPKPASVGPLAPEQKIDKLPLNEALERTNTALIKMINEDNTLSQNLIHIINTIMHLPQMYLNTALERDIQNQIIDIFSTTALNPQYPSDIDYIGKLTPQQNKLEQLIDYIYSTTNNELFRMVTSPVDIKPNQGGWGPQIPDRSNPSGYREPSNLERIMADDDELISGQIETRYTDLRNKVADLRPANMTNDILPVTIDTIIQGYLNNLVFCLFCERGQTFGQDVGLTKVLYLLVWYYYFGNYSKMFAKLVINNFKLMNEMFHTQILTDDYTNDRWGKDVRGHFASNEDGYLFGASITGIIDNPAFDNVRTEFDLLIRDILLSPNYRGRFDNRLRDFLRNLFTNMDNPNAMRIQDTPLVEATLENLLDEVDYLTPYKPTFDNLNIPDDQSWFDIFKNTIILIKPQSSKQEDNIFTGRYYNQKYRYSLPDQFMLPLSPLPLNIPIDNLFGDSYTLYEIFRIFQLVDKFLTTGNFQSKEIPDIFKVKITNWENYVNEISSKPIYNNPTTSINNTYPTYILLYRIFVKFAQGVITQNISQAMKALITEIKDDSKSTDPNVITMGNNSIMFNDAYIINLLMPSDPDLTEFTKTNDNLFASEKSVQWLENNPLVKWFQDKFVSSIPDEFVLDVGTTLMGKTQSLIRTQDKFIPYDVLNIIRQKIEENVAANINIIRLILDHNKSEFRKVVSGYLNVQRLSNVTGSPTLPVIPIIKSFDDTIKSVNLTDQYNRNLTKLKTNPKLITDLFFLTETYGYYFARVLKQFVALFGKIITINNILSDINLFIDYKNYYYIPQIFLPALIKQIVLVIEYLFTIQSSIKLFDARKKEFDPLIDLTKNENINIINLGSEFDKYITTQLKIIYNGIMGLVDYHNDVINYLNFTSARQLMNSHGRVNKIFTFNLIPIESFPDLFEASTNFNQILPILRLYSIPPMHYFNDASLVIDPNLTNRFGPFVNTDWTNADQSRTDKYQNIIRYHRSGQISNSPVPDQNYQLNIATNPATNNAEIQPIATEIGGQWLNFNPMRPDATTFYDAFIGYTNADKIYYWEEGMLPSIKSLVGEHLRLVKLHIIQKIIQKIINGHDNPTGPNEPLEKIYDDLTKLGTESTYNNVDPVKIYVLVGKLVDSLLNKFLEYVIKQSIASWIYSYADKNASYRHLVGHMINIIVQKDYLKLSLAEINKEAVKKLLDVNDKYIDYKLTQIEANPAKIEYSSEPKQSEFIHYLYNINYFSDSNANTYGKCYHINPQIAQWLITSDTINAQNSDGSTPLHYAVDISYPALVKLLLDHGAKTSFKNIHGQDVLAVSLARLDNHLKYTIGQTVEDSLNNFIIPFNDLLLSRLKDEKYNNNIIQNISAGIPVQLIMYNHLFHLYLANYQFGFTYELKKSINNLIYKYFGHNPTVYPLDLFEVDDDKLAIVLSANNPQTRVANAVNSMNSRKIESKNNQLKLLDIQLQALDKERNQTKDAEQLKFINDLKIELEDKRRDLAGKVATLNEPKPNDNLGEILAYNFTIDRLKNMAMRRNYALVDFYKFAFARFGNSPDLYLSIWKNYIGQTLKQTSSMIFSLTTAILSKIITNIKFFGMNDTLKAEITTISDFYQVVENYINSEKNYPDNYVDNPILAEQLNQIVYLINLIITPAVKNILLGQIYQAIQQMDGANVLATDQTALLDEISNVKFNGQTLESYLRNILPVLAVKVYTNIYNSKTDVDRRIVSGTDIFTPIIQIVQANRLVRITDDSLLVQNLNDYLIPFLANTYQNFIHHIRLASYGYNRYLLNTSQTIKIWQLLLNH